MSIKNIVFDFGNVIMRYDPDEMLNRFSLTESEKKLFKEKIFDDPKWKDSDRGYGYREILFYDTVKELPERLRRVFYALVARYDFEEKFMTYNEGIDELISSLKNNGYKIYLLSNIGLGFHVFNIRIPVFGLFDGKFATCDYGLIKPQKEVFEAFFERFELCPEECIFIDDSIENVNAGIDAGMTAFTYNAVNENTDSLREKLKIRGINADN